MSTSVKDDSKLSFIPPPPRALNGGLYTGEKFYEGAPWANVPVVPDVNYMTNVNLRSANPPPKALFQYPGNVRPGNNWQENTGLEPISNYNFACVSCETIKKTTRPVQDVCEKCKHISNISGNSFGQCECGDKIFIEI
jgi:hypothetical protein